VRALRDAGTMNPVIMLDEVDKVGADWRGDPSAALLEVLDPAQNHAFRDHYLDVELDLSQVMFIATANVAETIPGPLLDRMEVIRFDGYTVEEKVAIARDYLWPRQRERNGLREDEVTVDDAILRTVVQEYTREAGVRHLERELGTVLRKTATRSRRQASSRPWPSTSRRPRRPRAARSSSRRRRCARRCRAWPRAWRSPARAATCCSSRRRHVGQGRPGPDGPARRRDEGVARIALSYVRGHAEELGIDESAFEDREFHVHVPAGAIPKDGPSAGVTMVTALASLLTAGPVKHTVGMTGEVTLQGRVLPIGGFKQKALAAHAAGADRRAPSRAQPGRPSTTSRRRPREDDLPPGHDGRRGPRRGARAGPQGGQGVSGEGGGRFRRVAALFRPYRARLSAVLVLIVFSAGLGIISPFLLREVLDRAIPEDDLGLLAWLVGGMIAISVATGVIGVGQTWLSNLVGQRVMHDLRSQVFRHLQRLSLAFFTRTRTGEIQSRIANDIGGVQNVVTNTATSIASNFTTVIATVIAMFLLDWRLAIFSLALLPLFVWLSRRVGKQRKAITTVRQGAMADISALVQESLSVSGVLLARPWAARRSSRTASRGSPRAWPTSKSARGWPAAG
jgi:hypothetical protein